MRRIRDGKPNQESESKMNQFLKKAAFWTPRVFCIITALFLMIFSLDVFEEAHGFWQIALGLFMHNLPSLFMLGVLIVVWRWEWVGAVIFPALGILYIVLFWRRFVLYVYFLIAGPMFLLGILFLVGWIYRKEIRAAMYKPVQLPSAG